MNEQRSDRVASQPVTADISAGATNDARSGVLWFRAAAWLAFLGPFFFASYGFANWLASRHAHVPQIAFGWEHSIPFLPWTIIPYWSIDLLYTLSFFVCTTRRELDRHAMRLLAVQIVCVAFFIALPLRFSFDRPASDGIAGALFTALAGFDKPFNQAPSLHIALLVLIWTLYARHSPRRLRPFLHAWMALIGVSVLTTYQHHFIDVPTGVAAGAAILWAIPDSLPSPFRSFAFTRDRARLRLAALYTLGAIIFTALAFAGGWWLWSTWVAVSLAMVALNYAALGPAGFQKMPDGSMSVAAWILLAPYLLGAFANSRIWTRQRHGTSSAPAVAGERTSRSASRRTSTSGDFLSGRVEAVGSGDPPAADVDARSPHADHVIDDVWIGRLPSRRDLESFAALVDLAAELPCAVPARIAYTNVPILDLTVPTEQDLSLAAAAIERSRAGGPVLVCCALGYSRSASAIVVWLLRTKRARSVAEAHGMIRRVRPSIVLTPRHSEALEIFA